ncbi:hypothetical protein E3N88_46036 [Mikania micrantha]|uniref:Uncharacterized protein n=1 Tax=Mikania micrantha TaxID=192012 RepID=A0A5N6L9S4_9ASTR|nr:hypothetical protein E3N88_46036 [Mikania micrantha]
MNRSRLKTCPLTQRVKIRRRYGGSTKQERFFTLSSSSDPNNNSVLTDTLLGMFDCSLEVAVGWRGHRSIWELDEPVKRWFPARIRDRMWEELGLIVNMQWWWVVNGAVTAEIDDGRLDFDEKDELKESCENDCDRRFDS